ncbi:MAG: glycosyltransferase, partial [Deltaproteobacteria bacterium]|nr:glycosyltransferase [Deltaproteobacteria bacterium]
MTAWHQVLSLSRAGHAVSLVCGSLEKPFPNDVNVRVYETLKIGGRIRVPMRLLGTIGTGRVHDRLTVAYLRRSGDRWDIFHGWPLGCLSTLSELRKLGVPTVVERPNAHTAEAFRLVREETARIGLETQRGNPHKYNAAQLAREEREYGMADFIACPSEFVRDSFLKRGFSEERCIRHRYGFDDEAIE